MLRKGRSSWRRATLWAKEVTILPATMMRKAGAAADRRLPRTKTPSGRPSTQRRRICRLLKEGEDYKRDISCIRGLMQPPDIVG